MSIVNVFQNSMFSVKYNKKCKSRHQIIHSEHLIVQLLVGAKIRRTFRTKLEEPSLEFAPTT